MQQVADCDSHSREGDEGSWNWNSLWMKWEHEGLEE